jgi:hypothetical protein
MKNKITDLNNHLFAQLERLSDEEITPEQLAIEVQRAESITDISKMIVESAKITLDAMRIMDKAGMKLDSVAQNFLSSGSQS